MTIWRDWVLSCVALMALSINSDRAKGSVDFPCEAQNSQRVPYVYNSMWDAFTALMHRQHDTSLWERSELR